MTKNTLLLIVISLFSVMIYAQKEVIVKGQIINNTDFKTVYLENMIAKTDLDSSIIDASGKFSMKPKISNSDFFKLRFNDEQYVLLIIAPGENIEIEVEANNMFNPKIKGSSASESVYATYAKMKDFDEEMQQLSKQFEEKKKEYIRQYIINNLNSLSSLFFIDNLDIETDLELYNKLDKSLFKLYPDHSLVKGLHDRVKKLTLLAIGSEAPEIDMAGIKGKNIKLSSLRGKYVLIDFWAAWCGPCRKESPNIVALYKEYNKKGFEIYSVSLDNSQKDWETAIKKDGLGEWAHVSDLKYWSNAAAQEYGVDGIPYTVLIDKEGKIIAKGLRGDELRAKLKEIFN